LYVASTGALLEYDGVTWRRILTPARATVRSLDQDAGGRIYVGAIGDLGYIEADAKGQTQFVSLLDKIPSDSRIFEDVWRTFVTPEGVYFQTQFALFRWANGQMRVWKPTGRVFNRAQYVNGTLYLSQPGTGGLFAFKNDQFVLLPGTSRLADEAYPIILPFDDKHLLIGTRVDGLFLYDGATLTPFATEADSFFKSKNLYRGFILPNGSIALRRRRVGS